MTSIDPIPPGYGVDLECTCMDPNVAATVGHEPGCVYSTIQATVPPKIQGQPTCDCFTPAPLGQHLNTCPYALWRNSSSDATDHVLVVTIEQVQNAILATPIDTGASPDTRVIGNTEQTTLPAGLGVPPVAQGQGLWDQVANSVRADSPTAANDEQLAQQIHQQMGLTDLVSLGYIYVSLQAAREFDQKMASMR